VVKGRIMECVAHKRDSRRLKRRAYNRATPIKWLGSRPLCISILADNTGIKQEDIGHNPSTGAASAHFTSFIQGA
jgi:hypothetical protein